MRPPTRSAAAQLPLWLLLALVAIRLPVVATPFLEDDLHQLAYLARDTGAGAAVHPFAFAGPWDLFRFLDGDAGATLERMRAGQLPWRTDPTQRAAFLRPVASLLMWLDHALFGIASLPAHLHSLLWFVAFALAVRALYARLLDRRAAQIALLACLLSSASLQTVRWWSARNALLAALFGVGCLCFYLDWWESGRPSRLAASLGCLALALLSAESGLAVLAFPLAHAAVVGRRRPAFAARRAAPLLAAGALYVAARAGLGYGVDTSALYVDPLREPLAYLAAALPRLDRAVAIVFLNHATEIAWVVAPLAVALALLVVRHLRSGDPAVRLLGWLGLGSLLALSVGLASRSSLRPWTLLLPQVGAHAVLGIVVSGAWRSGAPRAGEPGLGGREGGRGSDRRAAAVWARPLAAALAAVCLLAPLYRHATAAIDALTQRRSQAAGARAAQFPDEVRRALDGAAYAVFLTTPYPLRPAPYLRLWHGLDVDPALRVLTVSDNPFHGGGYRWTRTGPRTFSIESADPLLRRNDLFRFDSRHPLASGDVLAGDGFRIEVLAMRRGGAAALAVALDLDLDDPRLVLLDWDAGRFRRVAPPPVGETAVRPPRRTAGDPSRALLDP